jgi:predicted phosphodiesterase
MLGDNMYGSERPQDFVKKFERPYQALLEDKVEFYAALGNHDDQNQIFYKPFNLGGKRYRTFKKGDVRFFVLDSNYLDPEQLKWLEQELQGAGSDWKIAYFHHPMYTSATRGPVIELRAALEPLFIKYNVDVVFSGHEHLYERIYPQKGIYYFTEGGSAKLRAGDITKTSLTASGFDTDRSFMLVEVAGDEMFFQTISRKGATIDSGILARRKVRTDLSSARNPATPVKQ